MGVLQFTSRIFVVSKPLALKWVSELQLPISMKIISILKHPTIALGFFLFCHSANADSYIFVINTTEKDMSGPSTAAYLDEHRWMKKWDSIVVESKSKKESIRVVPIRANSNHELKRALEFWMTSTNPNEPKHLVKGIVVYSHGNNMVLLNESQDFFLKLPTDIGSTFEPVIGRFSQDARVILIGCKVLWGQSAYTAHSSLKSFADAFQLKGGFIYANESDGLDPFTLFSNPFNSDIKTPKRIAAFVNYVFWPISSTLLPIMSKYIYNQGYGLKIKNEKTELIRIQQDETFEYNNFNDK